MRTQLASAAAALLLAACAAPTPTTLNPVYDGPAGRAPPKSAMAASCVINVTGLSDVRKSPETLGVVGGRAVKAPEDTQAWLRSVVSGLNTRGYSVVFDDSSVASTAVSAKFTLQIAWITDTLANKTANVVMLVEAQRSGATPLSQPYRGNVALINWAGTANEMQDAVNRAFGVALDRIATDLRPLCP